MIFYRVILSVLAISFFPACISPNGQKYSSWKKVTDNYEAFFNSLPRINGAIDLKQLTPVAAGGTHKIYSWEKNPDYLVKVMFEIDTLSEKQLEIIKNDLSKKYEKLYKIFGDQQCLIEHRFISQILVDDVSPKRPMIVSIVKFEPAFQSSEKFGFNVEAIEANKFLIQENIAKYHNMNAYLMGNNNFKSDDFVFDDFFVFNKEFKIIFSKLDDSASLRTAMKDFLLKFKSYFQETDQFMDFKGHDNVLFFKTDEKWDYRIGSVIKHPTGHKFINALKSFAKDSDFINKSFENKAVITYVPSWIRALNATGIKLGLGKIIEKITMSELDSKNLSNSFDALPTTEKIKMLVLHERYQNAINQLAVYEQGESVHNSSLRISIAINYWKNINRKISLEFGKEILTFLSVLAHPKNDFSALDKPRKKEISEVILKMRNLAQSKYLISKELKERIDLTLKEVRK